MDPQPRAPARPARRDRGPHPVARGRPSRRRPAPDDPFRGLYLSDEAVDRLLATPRASVGLAGGLARRRLRGRRRTTPRRPARRLRLRDLAGDLRAGPARRRPAARRRSPPTSTLASSSSSATSTTTSPGAAPRPRSRSSWPAYRCPRRSGHARLLHGPLVDGRPASSSTTPTGRSRAGRCECPTGWCRYLLGDDEPDAALAGVRAEPPDVPWGDPRRSRGRSATASPLAYLREPATGSGRVLAAEALRRSGTGRCCSTSTGSAAAARLRRLARIAVREARLSGAGLVAGPIRRGPRTSRRCCTHLVADPLPLLLVGDLVLGPGVDPGAAVAGRRPASTPAERPQLWQSALAGGNAAHDCLGGHRAVPARPEQVARAAQSARSQATLAPDARSPPTTSGSVPGRRTALRSSGWPAGSSRRSAGTTSCCRLRTLTALHEVAAACPAPRAGARRLADAPRRRPRARRRRPVRGDSGTGKTMSAEVVAQDLGLDLYVVDLATVVDKYVGETEKNLERIFTRRGRGERGAPLRRGRRRLRQALRGPRRPRPLRQHRERLPAAADGDLRRPRHPRRPTCEPTSTRRSPARLDVLVDFPLPDADAPAGAVGPLPRASVPRAADSTSTSARESFELAGGVDPVGRGHGGVPRRRRDGAVTMRHVVTAVQREYRKLGRLCLESEFGRYWPLLHESA